MCWEILLTDTHCECLPSSRSLTHLHKRRANGSYEREGALESPLVMAEYNALSSRRPGFEGTDMAKGHALQDWYSQLVHRPRFVRLVAEPVTPLYDHGSARKKSLKEQLGV